VFEVRPGQLALWPPPLRGVRVGRESGAVSAGRGAGAERRGVRGRLGAGDLVLGAVVTHMEEPLVPAADSEIRSGRWLVARGRGWETIGFSSAARPRLDVMGCKFFHRKDLRPADPALGPLYKQAADE